MSTSKHPGRQRAITVRPHADGLLAFASRHAPGFVMPETQHDWHKLLLLRSGSTVVDAGEAQRVSAGSVVIIPAGVRHTLFDEEPAHLYGLGLTPQAIHSLPALAAAWETLIPSSSSVSAASCRLIRSSQARGGERWWQDARDVLSALASGRRLAAWATVLALLARLPGNGPSAPGGVDRTLDWLAANPLEPLRVEGLAERAGVSVRTLSTRFNQRFGCNYSTWRRRQQVAAMANLLREGTAPLDAALAAGFGDLSHAYRQFKREHGHPPAAWAAQHGRRAPG